MSETISLWFVQNPIKELPYRLHQMENEALPEGVPIHTNAVNPSWRQVKVFLWFNHFVISSVLSTHPSCHSSPITVSVQPSTLRDPSGSMDSGTHSRISHAGCVARSKNGVLLLTLLCSEGNKEGHLPPWRNVISDKIVGLFHLCVMQCESYCI